MRLNLSSAILIALSSAQIPEGFNIPDAELPVEPIEFVPVDVGIVCPDGFAWAYDAEKCRRVFVKELCVPEQSWSDRFGKCVDRCTYLQVWNEAEQKCYTNPIVEEVHARAVETIVEDLGEVEVDLNAEKPNVPAS